MNKNFKIFIILLVLFALYSPAVFCAVYTIGSEFQINSYTTNGQDNSSVASNGNDYLVTWTSYTQDGNAGGIYGQRIDSSGNFLGTEFRVNTYTTNGQNYSSVASNGNDYLVTWTSYTQDGNSGGIYGQRIDSSGNFSGSEFRVNTYTTNGQNYSSVASNGNDYLVTWTSYTQDGSSYGIYGQRIDLSGNSQGSEFKINTHTPSDQNYPSVSSNGQGYLVAWHSGYQDGSYTGIYAQMIDSSGTLQGAEFKVNEYTINTQSYASVCSNGQDFIVVWQSIDQDGSDYGVYGQLIDSAGNFIGAEFLINTYTTNNQLYPSVFSNGDDYLVTWESYNQDGSSYGVYGQLIDSAGNLLENEFLVNTYTIGEQDTTSVTSNGYDFLVTWASNGQDGDDYGVYGMLITNDSVQSSIPEPISFLLLLSSIGIFIAKHYRRIRP